MNESGRSDYYSGERDKVVSAVPIPCYVLQTGTLSFLNFIMAALVALSLLIIPALSSDKCHL